MCRINIHVNVGVAHFGPCGPHWKSHIFFFFFSKIMVTYESNVVNIFLIDWEYRVGLMVDKIPMGTQQKGPKKAKK